MRRTSLALVGSLALAVPARGSGESRLNEYAEQVEALVKTMNACLDEIDVEAGNTTDFDLVQSHATERAAARAVFVTSLADLAPPAEMAEMHATALDIVQRVAEAEGGNGQTRDDYGDRAHRGHLGQPHGVAARAYDVEAVAQCEAAEGELDTTEERARLDGAPWFPEASRRPCGLRMPGCGPMSCPDFTRRRRLAHCRPGEAR